MNVRTLCLAILNFGDATGYEIKKMSSEGRFSYFVDVSYGSIYPTLAKMEIDGLVTCRFVAQDGKPDRKVYSITARGHRDFAYALAQPPQRDKFKSEFLLMAMCAEISGRENLALAIAARKDDIHAELATIHEALDNCSHPGIHLVARYGKAIKQASLEFLTDNEDELLALAEGGQALVKQAAE